MQVGLGDAGRRTVSGSVSLTTWRIACNDPPLSGQVLGPDWYEHGANEVMGAADPKVIARSRSARRFHRPRGLAIAPSAASGRANSLRASPRKRADSDTATPHLERPHDRVFASPGGPRLTAGASDSNPRDAARRRTRG
jgi:hypothetical protein